MKSNTLESRVAQGDEEAVSIILKQGSEIKNNSQNVQISGNDLNFNSIPEAKKTNRGYFDLDEKSKCEVYATQIIGGKYEQEDEMLLASITITNPDEYFRDIFEVMVERQRAKSFNNAGTTAAMYYFSPQTGEITTANLGDSRVYLTIKNNTDDTYTTVLITEDHTCDLERIRSHIEANGATVRKVGKAYRLNNRLALGGAIGDMHYVKDSKDPIVRYPDVTTYNISNLLASIGIAADISECEFTITNACDGLTNGARDNNYDYGVEISSNNAEGITPSFTVKPNEKGASSYDKEHSHMEKIGVTLSRLIERYETQASEVSLASFLTHDANTSNARGDNISISTCSFSGNIIGSEETGVLGAVFDGHSGHEVSQDCLECMKVFIQTARNVSSIRKNVSNQVNTIDIAPLASESLLSTLVAPCPKEKRSLEAAYSELNKSHDYSI